MENWAKAFAIFAKYETDSSKIRTAFEELHVDIPASVLSPSSEDGRFLIMMGWFIEYTDAHGEYNEDGCWMICL